MFFTKIFIIWLNVGAAFLFHYVILKSYFWQIRLLFQKYYFVFLYIVFILLEIYLSINSIIFVGYQPTFTFWLEAPCYISTSNRELLNSSLLNQSSLSDSIYREDNGLFYSASTAFLTHVNEKNKALYFLIVTPRSYKHGLAKRRSSGKIRDIRQFLSNSLEKCVIRGRKKEGRLLAKIWVVNMPFSSFICLTSI